MTCVECAGAGHYESIRCRRPVPRGECCGGCSEDVECPRCHGDGAVPCGGEGPCAGCMDCASE